MTSKTTRFTASTRAVLIPAVRLKQASGKQHEKSPSAYYLIKTLLNSICFVPSFSSKLVHVTRKPHDLIRYQTLQFCHQTFKV